MLTRISVLISELFKFLFLFKKDIKIDLLLQAWVCNEISLDAQM